MSSDKKEYDRFKGLLNGEQVNDLDSASLVSALSEQVEFKLAKSKSIYLAHDPCSIRKPDSSDMEHLGDVLSLEGQVTKGYQSFNSIVVDPNKKEILLLDHHLYSTKDPDYIKEQKVKQLKSGEVEDAALSSKIQSGSYHNSRTIYQEHLSQQSKGFKQQNPDVEITHISDREFDDESLFELIDRDLGDFFVTRLKVSRNSNESKQVLTPTGKISKKVAYKKLVDKAFSNKREESFSKLRIKGKVYQNVKRILEWEELKLNARSYTVLRITLLDRKGNPIFKQPMLLLTNHGIKNSTKARFLYKVYLLRSKIEMVFKFCKTNLGWESFQVRDFNSIRNILALVFFIAAYFYEIQKVAVKDPTCIHLAKIGGGKGKVTLHFILKGLEKLANHQIVQNFIEQNQMSTDELESLNSLFKAKPS